MKQTGQQNLLIVFINISEQPVCQNVITCIDSQALETSDNKNLFYNEWCSIHTLYLVYI